MDRVLQILLALITVLNSATGGEVDSDYYPDRPAIVAPTTIPPLSPVQAGAPTLAPSSVQIVNVRGTIQSIQNGTIVVDGQRIVVGANARVNGDLRVGAQVEVQADTRDGEINAREIRVEAARPASEPKPTEKAESKSSEKSSASSSSSATSSGVESSKASSMSSSSVSASRSSSSVESSKSSSATSSGGESSKSSSASSSDGESSKSGERESSASSSSSSSR